MRAVDGDGKDAHDVRAVRVIGDFAETLRLTLGAIHAIGHVEAFKCRVVCRVNLHFGFPDERAVGDVAGQAFLGQLWRDLFTVDPGRDQGELLSMQEEGGVRGIRIGPEGDPAFDPRLMRVQRKVQCHFVHDKAEGGIVGQIDSFGGSVAHGVPLRRTVV